MKLNLGCVNIFFYHKHPHSSFTICLKHCELKSTSRFYIQNSADNSWLNITHLKMVPGVVVLVRPFTPVASLSVTFHVAFRALRVRLGIKVSGKIADLWTFIWADTWARIMFLCKLVLVPGVREQLVIWASVNVSSFILILILLRAVAIFHFIGLQKDNISGFIFIFLLEKKQRSNMKTNLDSTCVWEVCWVWSDHSWVHFDCGLREYTSLDYTAVF